MHTPTLGSASLALDDNGLSAAHVGNGDLQAGFGTVLVLGVVVVASVLAATGLGTQARRRRGSPKDERNGGLVCATSAAQLSKGGGWPHILTLVLMVAVFVYVGVSGRFWSYLEPKSAGAGDFRCSPLTPDQRKTLIGRVKGVHHPIYTKTSQAQAHFEQGLQFRWAYNSREAAISFGIAHDLDPGCAMCLWGQAYALMPSLNVLPSISEVGHPAFNDGDLKNAWRIGLQAFDVAKYNAKKSPQDEKVHKELDYIEALLLALPDGNMTRRGMYQAGIHSASKWLKIWLADPQDVDAGVLAAENIINMYSWNTFGREGEPNSLKNLVDISWTDVWKEVESISKGLAEFQDSIQINTVIDLQSFFFQFPLPESMHNRRVSPSHVNMRLGARVAEEIVLRILSIDKMHPFANHLHIHLTEEGSPGVSKGGADQAALSAQNLAALAPNVGHLLHMPSHTFFRIGMYKEAAEVNIRAYQLAILHATGCISSYAPEHNLGVLISSASMAGMYRIAVKYSQLVSQVQSNLPGPYIPRGTDYEKLLIVRLRFGMWDDIEKHFLPDEESRGSAFFGGHQYSTVLFEFAQFMVNSQKHVKSGMNQGLDTARFETLITRIEGLIHAIPKTISTEPGRGSGLYASPYREMGHILLLLAKARLSYLRGEKGTAIGFLRNAVAIEDSLEYMEPRRFDPPLRPCLGWYLLLSDKWFAAIDVFHADLTALPENPWSLFGLAKAYETLQGPNSAQAAKYLSQYQSAWKGAKDGLQSSCPMLADY